MQIMVPCPCGDTDPTTWVTRRSGPPPHGTDPTTPARSHCHVARTPSPRWVHDHVATWTPPPQHGPTARLRSTATVVPPDRTGGSHLVHVVTWVPLDRTGGSHVHAGPLLWHGPTTRWLSTSTSAPTIPLGLCVSIGPAVFGSPAIIFFSFAAQQQQRAMERSQV